MSPAIHTPPPEPRPRLWSAAFTLALVSLGSVLGTTIGYAVTAFVAYSLSGMAGMSDFEGGRAMFAAFAAGPIGGIAGFFGGIWLVLHLRGQASLFGVLLFSILSFIPTGIVAAAIAGYFYFSDAPIYRDGSRLALEFEIRLPANAQMPPRVRDIRIELETAKNTITGDLDPSATRFDGERAVLVGEVELYYRTSTRVLKLQMPREPDRIFKLPLASSPDPFEEFTQWTRVDLIGGISGPPHAARESDDYDIRYRLPDPHKPVPHIEFEIRLPAGTHLPDDAHVLHIAQRRDDIDDDWGYFFHENWKRLEGDRPILSGNTAIHKPTKHPKLTLKLIDGPQLVFDLAFPADAAPTAGFGPWMQVSSLETFGQPARHPEPDDQFELRYRIDPPQ